MRDHPPLSVRNRREIPIRTPVYPHFSYRATDPNGIVEMKSVRYLPQVRATSVLLAANSEESDGLLCGANLKRMESLSATPRAFSP